MQSGAGSTNSTSVRCAGGTVLAMVEGSSSAQRLCTQRPSEESTR